MPIKQHLTHEIIEIIRATAAEVILPSYRRLTDDQVDTKEHRTDLVTVVDKAAEVRLTRELSALMPDAVVIGEEAVAEKPELLKSMAGAERVIIIDPIDGTWNYAKGHPVFGVIVSVIEKGETVFGIHYDPMSDEWIMAMPGEGAWACGTGRQSRRLQVAPARPDAEMTGFIPYYIFRYVRSLEVEHQLLRLFPEFDRIMSLRCSAHEYRMLAEGSVDFSLTTNTKPWDHVAGLLIHSEAGGYNALLDGTRWAPGTEKGMLLMANDADTHARLRERLSFLL